jgi:hypothetical protein
MLELGPILSFRGCTATEWQLSAIVVSQSNCGSLRWSIGSDEAFVEAEPLYTVNKRTVWRYEFSLPRKNDEAEANYEVCGQSYSMHIPGSNASPRLFYVSCNGFSDNKIIKRVRDKNALWKQMATRHQKSPHHLLLMGGDQVYADAMWVRGDLMKKWNNLSFERGNKASLTRQMEAYLKKFYFNLYCERWRQREVAAMLACIPMIAMWDDHDIIDGWGSYPECRQKCDVFKGIFAAARIAFAVFQQHLNADDSEAAAGAIAPENGFTRGHVVGNMAIIALDMRSERTSETVLTKQHWDQVFNWMDSLEGIDHLFVMSSIPVVYPGFEILEKVLGIIPGHQDLEDDLRDHWNSRPHRGERVRLIERLLRLANRTRITIVSGDVHVAALGVIESTRRAPIGHDATINQLISSGIVHPGPPAIALFALRHLFDVPDEIVPGIRTRMTNFPGLSYGFVGARNFLALEPDKERRIWANWWVEGETNHPYVKVIHPVGRFGA